MRTEFVSGTRVETVVTLAAAVLMTVAGFAMLADPVPADASAPLAVSACAAHPSG